METHKLKGDRSEALVAQYLEQRGYTIVDRNTVVQADGFRAEIDIIAADNHDKQLAFVEVKFRTTQADGSGVGAITPKKLSSMRRAAGLWLVNNPKACLGNMGARVDVIDVGPAGVRSHLKDVW